MKEEASDKKDWDKTGIWSEELEILRAIIVKTQLVETHKGGEVYTPESGSMISINKTKSYD